MICRVQYVWEPPLQPWPRSLVTVIPAGSGSTPEAGGTDAGDP
jgi:hypothetical protein